MATQDEICIGIDLGTTNTVAAYVVDGKPKIIPSEKGYTTVPSVVSLSKKNEVIVGHPALDQMVTNPTETIYGSKRLVGRKFNSMVVQNMMQTMTYKIVAGADGEAAVVLGGAIYSLSRISAFILGEIRDMAQGQLQREIRKAVITVPAYYNDNQRQAVKIAGKLAGIEVERIVNEPTSAAVAYGFNKGFDQKVMVYDLGGGTFDLSILHIHDNQFKVLATGGDTFLGGVDFDTRISEYVIGKFQEATGKDVRAEKVAVQRIRAACERAKRDLSQEKLVKIQLPYVTEVKGEPIDLHVDLSREQLNRLTVDLVDRTLSMCDEVLKSVNLKLTDLNEILLVGGQTRMPLVQNKIHQYLGRPPRKGVHPDEVVALGAAILANPGLFKSDPKLRDVLSIPIGVALPSGRLKPVLERHMPIPATKTYKLTLKPGESIEIDIYQGEHESILDNEYLGTFSFPPPPKGKKGEQKLELRFDLSAECLLTVQARDLETDQKTSAQMVTMDAPRSLKESMAAAVKDAKRTQPSWFTAFAQRVLKK